MGTNDDAEIERVILDLAAQRGPNASLSFLLLFLEKEGRA
jgi:hypothetical protein